MQSGAPNRAVQYLDSPQPSVPETLNYSIWCVSFLRDLLLAQPLHHANACPMSQDCFYRTITVQIQKPPPMKRHFSQDTSGMLRSSAIKVP